MRGGGGVARQTPAVWGTRTVEKRWPEGLGQVALSWPGGPSRGGGGGLGSWTSNPVQHLPSIQSTAIPRETDRESETFSQEEQPPQSGMAGPSPWQGFPLIRIKNFF